MARRPRLPVTGLPFHVVQRGNDRKPCFFRHEDHYAYLCALREAVVHYRVQVHAYVLMTNHVHLLVTPVVLGGIARLMQSTGARYVRYVNAAHGRTGTLWEGRYRACLVQDDRHLLAVCRYIDLNPVRAHVAPHPNAYPWSSYGALVEQRCDPLVTPHASLAAFGCAPGRDYARWCAQPIAEAELSVLREATNAGLAFGDGTFTETFRPSPRGRPADVAPHHARTHSPHSAPAR